MKTCTKCMQERPKTEFTKAQSNKNGLHSWCKSCTSRARMESYYKNPSVQRDLGRKYVKRNKEFVRSYKEEHPCVDCGYTDIRALQFDHINDDKAGNIADMVFSQFSLKRIKEEIKKCEVRCANCHLIAGDIRRGG